MSNAADYFEARGFSVYYFANIIFNVVIGSDAYLRCLEEILGDAASQMLMRPFHKYTNLHHFIREVVGQVLWEDLRRDDGDVAFLSRFLATYGVLVPPDALADEDAFDLFVSESERFYEALDELTDEVFHVLFGDVAFLQRFNKLCAGYIERAAYGEEDKTSRGTLRRVAVPVWARRAILHRDKGECRSCKRSLAAVINRLETERYDHIVPLARFGANDLTNLQLLCEPCNLVKAAEETAVSTKYQRVFRP